MIMNVEEWKEDIERARREKDMYFRGFQSPIPFSERDEFSGLNYYPPDPGYSLEIELFEHREKTTIKIEDTKGNIRDFVLGGEFRFRIEGVDCVLQAYRGDLYDERLFIPFRDLTSGKETYGAGRYLDLEPRAHRTAGGRWILDFNQAYNPWCAYSNDYACPFTPPENWLKVVIRAGEKNLR
jgi:uncharacterized protein